jgi:transcriptional regulator with XRE-family HTH domain
MSHNMKTKKRKTAKPTPASIRRNAIIRTWLAFSGVSISELGRRVSGSENSVKDILSGKVKQPTARTLQAIARHLGIETAALENDALPMPQFGYGADACGHARIRIPEACIARNELQELDFVPFPGNGIEVRLEQVEHLSMTATAMLSGPSTAISLTSPIAPPSGPMRTTSRSSRRPMWSFAPGINSSATSASSESLWIVYPIGHHTHTNFLTLILGVSRRCCGPSSARRSDEEIRRRPSRHRERSRWWTTPRSLTTSAPTAWTRSSS